MTTEVGRGSIAAASRTIWIAAYLVAVLAPFVLMLAARPLLGRTFGVEFAAALGFAALNTLALQFVLPARSGSIARPFGVDILLRYHRQIGVAVIGLVVVHVVVLIIDEPSRLSLFWWPRAPARARAATVATVALGLLAVTSSHRRRFRLSYEAWRGVHIALGLVAVALVLVHVAKVGRYAAVPAIWVASLLPALVAVAASIHLRVRRPARTLRRPYLVESTVEVAPGVTQVQLLADGHRGDFFTPGQFAWLKLADAPRSLDEHPFSYASSALRPNAPRFAIKSTGDFTRRVGAWPPGTRILVDGPHGSFRPAHPDAGYLLVAAGVGVTPMLSVLRTLDDRHDERPVVLLYGNRTLQDIAFADELAALETRLVLRVEHVLSRPPQGWSGHGGRIDETLLARVVPSLPSPVNVLVCGPAGLADTCRRALPGLGIPPPSIHLERFDGV